MVPVVDDVTSHAPDGVGVHLVDAREHLSERQVAAETDELPADLFARRVRAFGAGEDAGLEHGGGARNVVIRCGVGEIEDAALQAGHVTRCASTSRAAFASPAWPR